MAQQIKTKFIEDLAITTAKIAASAVTGAKIETSVALAGSPTTTTQSYGTNDTKIATTAFVQSALNAAVAGLKPKEAARVASSTNVVIASGLENGDTVDGITLVTGDRVLLLGQTAPAENGIYVVVSTGAGTRATDFDSLTPIDEINRSWVPVQEGTHAGKIYVQYGTVTTIGTDPITFTYYDPIASLTGGDMITTTGSTISVDLATVSGLESTNPGNVAGQLRIKLESSNPTLQIDGSNQLGVKFYNKGLQATANGLDVLVGASGGLEVITSGPGTGIAIQSNYGVYTDGDGLNVLVDNLTLEIDTADTFAVRVKDAGITAIKLAADVTLQEILNRGHTALFTAAGINGIDITMDTTTDGNAIALFQAGSSAALSISNTGSSVGVSLYNGTTAASAIDIINDSASSPALNIQNNGDALALSVTAGGFGSAATFFGSPTGDIAVVINAGVASDQYGLNVNGDGGTTKAAARFTVSAN